MINLNKMKVGNRYILTLRDGEEKEMVCCNKYIDYVNFGYFNWNFYFNGKYKGQDLPSMDIISYCNAPLTEVENLRQQLQAKEEEIKELKKAEEFQKKCRFELADKLQKAEENRDFFKQENQSLAYDLHHALGDKESLQTKLQQAKEGLEFYASNVNYLPIETYYTDDNDGERDFYLDDSLVETDRGEKARETLEMINKE